MHAVNDGAGDTKENNVEEENAAVAADGGDGDAKNDATTSENSEAGNEHTAMDAAPQKTTKPAPTSAEDGDNNKSDKKRAAVALIPAKPKKARTGYMIFQDDLREKGISIVRINFLTLLTHDIQNARSQCLSFYIAGSWRKLVEGRGAKMGCHLGGRKGNL